MSLLSQLSELADNMMTTETAMIKRSALIEVDLVSMTRKAVERFVWFQQSLDGTVQSRALIMYAGALGESAMYTSYLSPLEASGEIASNIADKARTGIFVPSAESLRPIVTRNMEGIFASRATANEMIFHCGLTFINLQTEVSYMTDVEWNSPHILFKLVDRDSQVEQRLSRNFQTPSSCVQNLVQNVSVFACDYLNPKFIEKLVRSEGIPAVQLGSIGNDYNVLAPRTALFSYAPASNWTNHIDRIALLPNTYVQGYKQFLSSIILANSTLNMTQYVRKGRIDKQNAPIPNWSAIPEVNLGDFMD
jgi:hypothetical protein